MRVVPVNFFAGGGALFLDEEIWVIRIFFILS